MVHKQLFLSGGAEGQIKDMDLKFASMVLRTKSQKLLYLPVAHPEMVINNVLYTHERMYQWFKKHFSQFGIEKTDMWENLSSRTIEELRSYGGIYISGGNTYSLLNQMKGSGFDKTLSKYVDEGGIVYGSSAGAIIFGKSIETVCFGDDPDVNRVNLKDFNGLNKTENFDIVCHYNKTEDDKIETYSSKSGHRVICIPSKGGIYLENDKLNLFGEEDAYVINSSERKILRTGVPSQITNL